MPPTFEILSLASIAYSGFNSRPIYLRLFNFATSPVVPDPMKGSITMPCSGQQDRIGFSINSGG